MNISPTNTIWEKTYGGKDDDRAFYAVQFNEGYLVVGSSRSIVADTIVGWALKLDNDGNIVWNKTFLEGLGTELRHAIVLADGFLLVGNEFLEAMDVNGFVAKIDFQGALLWKITMGGEEIDKLFSGIVTEDGFAVLGLTYSNRNSLSNAWVVKLDKDGNVVWNEVYGGSGECVARTGVLTQEGHFVISGYTCDKGDNNYDFCLLKVDANGNLIWNKTYGGEENEKAYATAKAINGYVLAGEINSMSKAGDAWVLKVDNDGKMLWNKTVGGKHADSPAYITTVQDGGYIVAGFTFSFGQGQRDFWLFKISDQGQVIFSCTQGDEAFQEAYSVIETGNNEFVVAGWTDPIDQPTLIGKAVYDFYIVKLFVAKNNGSSFQFIVFVATAIAILIATLLVLPSIAKKRKIVTN